MLTFNADRYLPSTRCSVSASFVSVSIYMEQSFRRCGDTDRGRKSEVSIFLENMSFLANQCVGFCEMRRHMAFRSCAGLPSLVLAYGWDATFFALTILIMCTL
jgi:hypothetical protein